MKRFVSLMAVLCMLCGAGALGEGIDLSGMTDTELEELQVRIREELNSRPDEHGQMIAEALEVLKAGWKKEYDEHAVPGTACILDIRGVRVVELKKELEEQESKVFGDTRYIVEFLFYDDFRSAFSGFSGHNAGYTDMSLLNDSVLVDGQNNMTLATGLIRRYALKAAETDYSSFIEKVTDYRDRYNRMIEFP